MATLAMGRAPLGAWQPVRTDLNWMRYLGVGGPTSAQGHGAPDAAWIKFRRLDHSAGCMRRRDFLKAVAGSATVWPLVGRAQQGQRMRRIGVLMNLAADDKEGQARLIAFVQTLSDLGWKNTGNVQIDTCWGAGDTDRFHQCAAELEQIRVDFTHSLHA